MENVDVTDSFAEPKKKRLPLILRILCTAGIVLAMLVLALLAWTGFSALDRKHVLSVLPPGAALYLHTDSAWDAVNPLIDLEVADLLLSEPALVQFRPGFMALRSSDIRGSKLVSRLASRRVDAAMYVDGEGRQEFVAAVDMGALSAATRLLPIFASWLPVPSLSYTADADMRYFVYDAGGKTVYAKPFGNLVVVSTSFRYFREAVLADNSVIYTERDKALLTEKSDQSVRLLADARKLLAAQPESPLVARLSALLAPDSLTVLSFSIDDSDVQVTARLPLSEDASALPLLARTSTLPALLARLGDSVQYYTILNAGTLSELKAAVFPYIPPEKDADVLWKKADSACRTLFSFPLETILFSWTGTEFSAFGLEGQNMPVFAVKIQDEAKRAEIFDKVLSSFLVKDDTSLILDGVRLPRLTVPSFIGSLLALFDVSLPSPYYLVHEGYIYFSVAPEALSAVYTSMQSGRKLTRHANWRAVAGTGANDAAVSLFYNLERSVPFFLRSAAVYSKVLQLYTIGKADMHTKAGEVTLQLHAASRRAGDLRAVPGFPVTLEGKTDGLLYASPGKSPDTLFWLEDGSVVRSFAIASTARHSLALPENATLVACAEPVRKTGVLWAVTAEGGVYLLDRALEPVAPFPVLIGERPSAPAASAGTSLLVPLTGGSVCTVDENGFVSLTELPVTGSIRSAPAVFGKTAAVYDKSFAGKIWLLENGSCVNKDEPLSVPGIAFGSPAFLKKGNAVYMAFVTQAGACYLWADGKPVDGFPMQLEGVFYQNAVASGSYFYVLSAEALLYRIGTDGSVLSVAVPHSTAKNAFLTAAEPNKNGVHNIYVSPDGNTLYGFTSGLELIAGFPVAGRGVPVFADVNGDKNADCFVLTLDNTLTVWNLR